MSFGERSCRFYEDCPIPEQRDIDTCTINCREFEWNGTTKPDTGKLFLNEGEEDECEDFFQE